METNPNNIDILYQISGIALLFIVGFAIGTLKKQFFNLQDDPEMIIQAERYFLYNFSTESQEGKSSFPMIIGSIAKKTDSGVQFNSITKPSNDAIL